MNLRTVLISIFLVALVVTASVGCVETERVQTSGDTQAAEAKLTEQNQERLNKAVPAPSLDTSLERQNLKKRLELLNDENKIFYVYLVNHGQVMTYFTAQGKISSVNSKLTTGEQVIDARTTIYPNGYGGSSTRLGAVVVESPALDGSYGTNGDAIFFFTTEGAYVEWAGDYMLSDYPLQLTTPVQMVASV